MSAQAQIWALNERSGSEPCSSACGFVSHETGYPHTNELASVMMWSCTRVPQRSHCCMCCLAWRPRRQPLGTQCMQRGCPPCCSPCSCPGGTRRRRLCCLLCLIRCTCMPPAPGACPTQPCPVGTYGGFVGVSSCDPCDIDTYSNTPGATVCQARVGRDVAARPCSATGRTLW